MNVYVHEGTYYFALSNKKDNICTLFIFFSNFSDNFSFFIAFLMQF